MMESIEPKYTNTPWKINHYPGGAFDVFTGSMSDGSWMLICSRNQVPEELEEEGRANANLIVAAPKMFDALEKYVAEHEEWLLTINALRQEPPYVPGGHYDLAVKALAEARGM